MGFSSVFAVTIQPEQNGPCNWTMVLPTLSYLLQWRGQPRVKSEAHVDGTGRLFVKEQKMAKLTSFEADIRPLFTDRDIHAMSKAFNLANYEDVKNHSASIYDRIRGIGGALMPPPPPRGEGPWPQSRIELFAKWIADGFQP
jgi:hypothetical protein